MHTYQTILAANAVTVPEHLVADAEVPVLTGMQRQGDLIVRPARPGIDPGSPIPPEGIPVVRGESGGHTHLLVGDGTWSPAQLPVLGTLTVPAGGAAFLLHPEHGAQGVGVGCYRIERQQEYADVIRIVAD